MPDAPPGSSTHLLPPRLGALAARLVLVHAGQLERVWVVYALRARHCRRRLLGLLLHVAQPLMTSQCCWGMLQGQEAA